MAVAAGVEAAIRIKVMEAKVEVEAGVEINGMAAVAVENTMEAMVVKTVRDV